MIMFDFKINAKGAKSLFISVFIHLCGPYIILFCIVFLLGAYCTICGFLFDNSDVLRTMGYPLLALAILLAYSIVWIHANLRVNNAIGSDTNDTLDGIVEYQLRLSEEGYEVANMTKGTKIKIRKNDIVKRIFLKRTVLIKLVNGIYMAFPKTKETEALFG
jgi:hypothetical protein